MYFSIILFSNIAPDDVETTGCSGTSFVTGRNKFYLISGVLFNEEEKNIT